MRTESFTITTNHNIEGTWDALVAEKFEAKLFDSDVDVRKATLDVVVAFAERGATAIIARRN